MAGRSAAAPLVISDVAALRSFAGTRGFASSRPLVLDLPQLAPGEAFTLGEQLNRDRAECGCALGAKAMTAGFGVALGLLMVAYGPLTVAFLEHSPLALAAAFGCAGAGKVAGISLGRRRARRRVVRILESLTVEP